MVDKSVWSAVDCERCNDWEQVYYCIDCSKFYCTHCLINDNGKLGCPSGIGHRIISVESHFDDLKTKVSQALDDLKKIRDIVNEIINNLKIAKSSSLSLRHMKIYSYVKIEDGIKSVIESLNEFFTGLIENLNDLGNQYQGIISSIFRYFNNGNYHESMNSSKLLLNKIRELGDGITKCRNESVEVAKKAEKIVFDFSSIAPKLSHHLINDELIYKIVKVGDVNKFLTVLTTRRIMIIKGKKIIGEMFYESINRMDTKRGLLFKGIEIHSNNKHIRIPCTDFRCSNLINDIEHAKNINIDILTTDVNIDEMENKIDNFIENIDFLRKKLKNGMINLITTHTKRLLSRFYYSGLENQRSSKSSIINNIIGSTESRNLIKKGKTGSNHVFLDQTFNKSLDNQRTSIFTGNEFNEEDRGDIPLNSLGEETKPNRIVKDVLFKHKGEGEVDGLVEYLSLLKAIEKMKERIDQDFRDGLISPALFYKIYSQLIEKEEKIRALLKKHYPDKVYF